MGLAIASRLSIGRLFVRPTMYMLPAARRGDVEGGQHRMKHVDPPPQSRRLLRNERMQRSVEVRGVRRSYRRDAYHRSLKMPWFGFGLLLALIYLGVSGIFGLLYRLDPRCLAGGRGLSCTHAFRFSMTTLASLGGGATLPSGLYANSLVFAESFARIIMLALATGVIFARISRPTSRIRFTSVALVTPFDGRRTFMFRVGNERANMILEAEVNVVLARSVTTAEGLRIRRLEEVRMQRARTPLFALTWTALHVVDETSPFHGATMQSLEAEEAEVIIVLSGLDEAFAQRVHARHSYTADEIVFDRHYADVVEFGGRRGGWSVDYTSFDRLQPTGPQPAPTMSGAGPQAGP